MRKKAIQSSESLLQHFVDLRYGSFDPPMQTTSALEEVSAVALAWEGSYVRDDRGAPLGCRFTPGVNDAHRKQARFRKRRDWGAAA